VLAVLAISHIPLYARRSSGTAVHIGVRVVAAHHGSDKPVINRDECHDVSLFEIEVDAG
jgi:hypothetical protein